MAALAPRPIVRGLARLALLALVWCTLTGGVFSGCRGLFTPAIPEPPKGDPVILNYRSPTLTLLTMAEGMRAKTDGRAAWLGAFADSSRPEDGPAYHQFFDDRDVVNFRRASGGLEPPADWRLDLEEEFFLDFLNLRPSDDYRAAFEPVEQVPDPATFEDVVTLYRHYQVDAIGLDETARTIAIGYAYLTLTRVSTDRWLITRWQDGIDPQIGDLPSDSDLQTLGRRRLESTR